MTSSGVCFICECPNILVPGPGDSRITVDFGGCGGDNERAKEVDEDSGLKLCENVVFVLNKVFQVPAQVLIEDWAVLRDQRQLEQFGLCGRCVEVVEKGKEIYNGLLEAVQAFRKVQLELVRFVKSKGKDVRNDQGGEQQEVIFKKWRKLIESNNYGSSKDPFLVEEYTSVAERLISISRVTVKDEPGDEPTSPWVKEEEPEDIPRRADTPETPDEEESMNWENEEEHNQSDAEEDASRSPAPSSSISSASDPEEEYVPKTKRYKIKRILKKYDTRNPCPCPIPGCSKVLKTARKLTQHLANTHKIEKLRCKLCSKDFNETTEIYNHAASEHPELTCQVCKLICGNQIGLKNHLRSAHQIISKPARLIDKVCKDSVCNCGKAFRTWETLRVHLSKVKGTPKYKCRHCDQLFYSFQQRQRHEDKAHSSGEKFICEMCGKAFLCKQYMLAHMGIAHLGRKRDIEIKTNNSKKFICHECGKELATKASLDIHVKTVHEGRREFSCTECEKTFIYNVDCKRHMYTVHQLGDESWGSRDPKTSNFRCSVVGCRQAFWGQNAEMNLKRHKEKEHGEHGNDLRFRCDKCGKGFALECKLREHLDVHENKETKPFKCETCGKGFAARMYLRVHDVTIHNAPKMFQRRKETRPRSYLESRSRKKKSGDGGEGGS